MQDLIQSSVETFRSTSPDDCKINLLISGTLDSYLTELESDGNTWNFKTGSWSFDRTNPNTSSLKNAYIVGATISTIDQQGNSNLNNFRVCDKLQLTVTIGKNFRNTYTLNIRNKSIEADYVYFEVESASMNELVPDIEDVKLYFKSQSGGDGTLDNSQFLGYECEVDTPTVSLILEPIQTRVEYSVFNPTVNNVSSSTAGTIARNVEAVYGSSSVSTTVYSEISDYFFTGLANQSGRFLGAKNSYVTRYDGNKESFTDSNLQLVSKSIVTVTESIAEGTNASKLVVTDVIETGIDRPFFTVQGFTGSIFPSGTLVDTIKSMSMSDMEMETLGFVPKATYESSSLKYIKIGTAESVPTKRDIVLNSNTSPDHRITEKNIYVKELNQVITTDKYGHIAEIN